MLPEAFGRRGRDYDSRGGGMRGGGGGGGMRDDWDSRDRPRNGDWDERQRDRDYDRRGPPPPRRDDGRRDSWDDDRRDRGRSPPPWREMPQRSFRDEPVEKSMPSDWSRHLLASHPAEAQGERLVLAGAKVVVPPPPAASLWRALEELDEVRAEKLLQEASEEEINRRGGPYASTPLGWAAQAGSTRLVRTLLARSADPNIAAEKGSLPLHMAAWNGGAMHPPLPRGRSAAFPPTASAPRPTVPASRS